MAKRPILAVSFVFLLALFIYGSATLPFLGPDEPRYSQVARQMQQTGDYVVPHLGPFVWFEKPVLLYWMMSGFFSLFGVNEFAARLPSALAAILTVWLVFATVRRIAGELQAIVTAIVLGTTAFFLGFSHAATFDMLLTFAVSASLCLLVLFHLHPDQKSYIYGAYLFAGLGVLAKGLVALIIIGLVACAFIFWNRDWKNISRYKPLQGLVLVIGVAAIWFLPISVIYGTRFWDEFVYQHHFVRYTSSFYHRAGSPLFYFPILVLGTYPWTAAPLLGIPLPSPEMKSLYRFATCWLAAPVIFFSFSQSKLPGYILPCAPAFAILAGAALTMLIQQHQRKLRAALLFGGLNVALFIALLWGSSKYPEAEQILTRFGILTIIATGAAITFSQWRFWISAFICYLAIPVIGVIFAVEVLPPYMNWQESKQLSLEALPQLGTNGKLALYNVYDFSPLFYANARVELTPEGYIYNIANDRQLYRYLQENGEAFVLVANEELDWMLGARFWKIVHIIHGNERSIVHLRSLKQP